VFTIHGAENREDREFGGAQVREGRFGLVSDRVAAPIAGLVLGVPGLTGLSNDCALFDGLPAKYP